MVISIYQSIAIFFKPTIGYVDYVKTVDTVHVFRISLVLLNVIYALKQCGKSQEKEITERMGRKRDVEKQKLHTLRISIEP